MWLPLREGGRLGLFTLLPHFQLAAGECLPALPALTQAGRLPVVSSWVFLRPSSFRSSQQTGRLWSAQPG